MASTVFGVAESRLTLNEITGRIPVCITLSREDVIQDDQPHQLYFLVPRTTYPMAFAQSVIDEYNGTAYVADFGTENPPNVWLTWGRDNVPVPWTMPVGVFADLSAAFGRRLPLTFTARLTHAPLPPEVADARTKSNRQLMYSQLYKQSVVILFGEIKPALDLVTAQVMALREQGEMLEETSTHKYEDAVRAILAHKSQMPLQSWPVEMHLVEDKGRQIVSHRLLRVPIVAGQTFGAFLRSFLPQARPLSRPDADASAVSRFDTCPTQDELITQFGLRAVVLGIEPPLAITMEYLNEQMISCDLRLHIVVAPASESGDDRLISISRLSSRTQLQSLNSSPL